MTYALFVIPSNPKLLSNSETEHEMFESTSMNTQKDKYAYVPNIYKDKEKQKCRR